MNYIITNEKKITNKYYYILTTTANASKIFYKGHYLVI